ncbi:MAG: tyrosinase family protein [Bacteroidetes bacterium]|nr:tyrosinase family protein [Bacteroidota bacterium]
MSLQILVNNAATPDSNYLTWSPSECTISMATPATPGSPTEVILRSRQKPGGGQLIFFDGPGEAQQDQLTLTIPADGTPVKFLVAGKFGFASTNDKDVSIEVVEQGSGAILLTKEVMVRIRKNANKLTTAERDRFVAAFGTMNRTGKFDDFRNMHLRSTQDEAHGNDGFLPWHRAYLLDLERELQKIDASVALPYWKFDEPAPKLFSPEFIGVPGSQGRVRFTSGHPFNFWTTDGVVGIIRTPRFQTQTQPANVISEQATINLGQSEGSPYSLFVRMEGRPHGSAHTSFAGSIDTIHTAAKDPLFFLLHCNVDRLWAKWQWVFDRYDTTAPTTYPFLGAAGSPGATRIGHNLKDTMWPWNQVIGNPRPGNAPGGTFPGLQFSIAPSAKPFIGDMIDYQGHHNPDSKLGFDYDDTPFE